MKRTHAMKKTLFATCAAAALVFVGAGRVAADPISYGYSWNVNSSVSAGAGSVTFSNGDNSTSNGSTNTVAAYLKTMSTASMSSPDIVSGSYTAAITLTDLNTAGHPSATLTFTGMLNGTLTAQTSVTSTSITGVSDGMGFHAGQTFDAVLVGSTLFDVSFAGYAPPGSPKAGTQGALSFNISASLASPGGDPHPTGGGSTPEPSTMLLGGIGAALSGLAAWRRRRAQVVA
jgi:hypothetical protein